jgi:tetratricopeptide (TPR) repeat protein
MPSLGIEAANSPPTVAAPRRFAAFISYSHDDERVARWLQGKLETYRLPRGLRASVAERADQHRGKGGDRLGAIFRDREDFAAASSLSDAIRQALADSQALIVLCSPTARASVWVNAEIALFRELHPDRPILAAIVDGEPEEAMPAALVAEGREPLAADLRKVGDGRRVGLLKIVAALWGLPLGVLIDRDSRRRLRTVIAVTVAGAVAMAIMATMTGFALHSRNEAQRQRAEAEGLVEYMLTDLRTRLRGVGSLPVMSAVNDRALDYYRNQGDLDALPDDSLERRARVLQAMGEDEMRRDRLDVARDRVHAAFASTEALMRRDPDNPDRIFAHAQSEFWVGELARRQGDEAEGARRMRNYAALAERLRVIDPDHVRALREVGYANGNLCSLAVRSPDPIVSDNCAIALDAMREVRALRPEDPQAQVDLINRLTWHGEYEHRAGRIERANRAWTEALAQTRQLVASDPDNRDSLDMLVAVLLTSGKFGLETDPTEARRRLAEADSIINDLSRFDPSNERWRRLREDVAELRSR